MRFQSMLLAPVVGLLGFVSNAKATPAQVVHGDQCVAARDSQYPVSYSENGEGAGVEGYAHVFCPMTESADQSTGRLSLAFLDMYVNPTPVTTAFCRIVEWAHLGYYMSYSPWTTPGTQQGYVTITMAFTRNEGSGAAYSIECYLHYWDVINNIWW